MFYKTNDNGLYVYGESALFYLVNIISDCINMEDLKQMKHKLINQMREDPELVDLLVKQIIRCKVKVYPPSIDAGNLWNDDEKITNFIALIWRFTWFILKNAKVDMESAYAVMDAWDKQMEDGVINEGQYLDKCNILKTQKKICDDIKIIPLYNRLEVVIMTEEGVDNMYAIKVV
jgi:hypothetical protein